MRKSYRALEIKVGFTVFIAGVILIIGLMWFQGFKISRDYYELHAVFPQVGGIDPGDEVNVNGVERGSVKSVSLRESDVLVTMEIDSDTRIASDYWDNGAEDNHDSSWQLKGDARARCCDARRL